MNVLEIEVSYFGPGVLGKPTRKVILADYLRDPAHVKRQEKVREAKSKEEAATLKNKMPGITPSGLFSYRSKANLLKHSGLIAVDFDSKDNTHILNFEDLKAELSKVKNIAYCGRSVSGKGFWALVPILYPEKHREHFDFLRLYFASKGLVIDPSGSDVSRFRFYSYDPEAYFNPHAEHLQDYYTPPAPVEKPKSFSGDGEDIFQDYNNTPEFIDVLISHGWSIDSENPKKIFFRRPGKGPGEGHSAEFDIGKNVFFVFSSNAEPFKAQKGYNPAQIFTLLEHGGDYKAAANRLRAIRDFSNVSIYTPIKIQHNGKAKRRSYRL